jgi:hypothetical protein
MKEKLTEGWRKLYMRSFIIFTLHLSFLGRYFKEMGQAGHATSIEMRNGYVILAGKTEEKRPLGNPRVDGRINEI